MVEKSSQAKNLKALSSKISKEPEYMKKLLSNYNFAKKELARTGMDLDLKTHRDLVRGFETLNAAATKLGASALEKSKADVSVGVSVAVRY